MQPQNNPNPFSPQTADQRSKTAATNMPLSPKLVQAPDKSGRQESVQKLQHEIDKSNDTLVQATTVFPFTLFPDTVTIDRSKLTITHRTFFAVAEVMSIRIEDVLNVTANVGPFFGSIKISTRFFDLQKPYTVNYFWRADALRIKRIMQGYIIATQKDIDCSTFSAVELANMLDELGKGATNE